MYRRHCAGSEGDNSGVTVVVADNMTITTATFAAHLRYLRDHGYMIIPLRQFVRYRQGVAMPPPPSLGAARLSLEIASTLFRLHPMQLELARTLGLIGARWVVSAIRADQDPGGIVQQWQPMLEAFRA